jgi:hypothetical protein
MLFALAVAIEAGAIVLFTRPIVSGEVAGITSDPTVIASQPLPSPSIGTGAPSPVVTLAPSPGISNSAIPSASSTPVPIRPSPSTPVDDAASGAPSGQSTSSPAATAGPGGEPGPPLRPY